MRKITIEALIRTLIRTAVTLPSERAFICSFSA
jgi:hypothetical protein